MYSKCGFIKGCQMGGVHGRGIDGWGGVCVCVCVCMVCIHMQCTKRALYSTPRAATARKASILKSSLYSEFFYGKVCREPTLENLCQASRKMK